MSEVINNTALNSYYSSNPKAQRPDRPVATPPEKLPTVHVYSDREATKKLQAINNDIYVEAKKESPNSLKNFIKFVVPTALVTLAIVGLKRFFKKS